MTDEIILMKLGGSLITDKKSETPKCHLDVVSEIANIISKFDQKIIIVHGAGSYAHPIVKKHNIDKGIDGTEIQEKAILQTRKQLLKLNRILSEKIKKTGMECESIIPSQTMSLDENNALKSFPKEKFDSVISNGKIAITFGDIVNIGKKNVGILSGDTLLLKLAQLYRPKRTFFVMDYPGVVKGNLEGDNPEIYDKIDSEYIDRISILKEENRPDVTGGLVNKIQCALEISKICECWITGLENLEDCISGIPKGTRVIL